MTNPFLLCLTDGKIADVVQKLDDYQKKHHRLRFKRPAYLDEVRAAAREIIINAPSYQEEEEIRLDKEMRWKPHHPGRVG